MALRQYYLILALPLLVGAAPSRTQTYTAGQVISPTAVTENEDNIFAYLQAGVDTLRSNSVLTGNITDGTITNADIASSAAIPYSKLSLASSIVTGDITDSTLVNADISGSAAIAYSKLNLASSIVTGDITDNTVTATDLAATLTFADGDFINFSAINTSSGTEGVVLPQAASCGSGTVEGQICWETGDTLRVGTGAATQIIGGVNRVIGGWIKFNGTGTLAISDSFNVSSVTDNGTGDYTVNWTTAFSNANYAVAWALEEDVAGAGLRYARISNGSQTTSAVRLETNDSTTLIDLPGVHLIAIGDP